LNATLRRIDLLCKMLAPLFVALLTSTTSTIVAVYFIGVWNIASLLIEYGCLLMVYNSSPILSVPKPIRPEQNEALRYLGTSRWEDLKYCFTSPLILGKGYSSLMYTIDTSNSFIFLSISNFQLCNALPDRLEHGRYNDSIYGSQTILRCSHIRHSCRLRSW
jgi:hypothetical protein